MTGEAQRERAETTRPDGGPTVAFESYPATIDPPKPYDGMGRDRTRDALLLFVLIAVIVLIYGLLGAAFLRVSGLM